MSAHYVPATASTSDSIRHLHVFSFHVKCLWVPTNYKSCSFIHARQTIATPVDLRKHFLLDPIPQALAGLSKHAAVNMQLESNEYTMKSWNHPSFQKSRSQKISFDTLIFLYYITVVYGIGIVIYIYIYMLPPQTISSCLSIQQFPPNFSCIIRTNNNNKGNTVLGMIYACSLAWSLWQDLGYATARTHRAKSASRPCHETLWSFSWRSQGDDSHPGIRMVQHNECIGSRWIKM